MPAGARPGPRLQVQEIENKPGYHPSVGAQLGIDTPSKSFEREAHQCQLLNLVSNAPPTVSGKFRKAGGNVDGFNLYGRKSGTAAWTLLGRFSATAMRADVKFGQGGAILPVTVRA